MKKIMIIDGGPRRNMNTAQMLQKVAEGVKSVNPDIEVKTVRLYEMDYKGCMSCMVCKLKDKASNVCKFKDALTPILEEIAGADGLVLGSPVYLGNITAQMRIGRHQSRRNRTPRGAYNLLIIIIFFSNFVLIYTDD